MAMNRLRIPKNKISLAQQDMFLRHEFPQFQFVWEHGTGIWRGTLQPREISPIYSIMIKYAVGLRPKVWVTKPQIRYDSPHIFKDNSLCLWWYKEWDWSPTEDISKTVVPWAAIWLYYYELWMDNGEWLGPSAPHSPNLGRS
jgi:hypothetical protein